MDTIDYSRKFIYFDSYIEFENGYTEQVFSFSLVQATYAKKRNNDLSIIPKGLPLSSPNIKKLKSCRYKNVWKAVKEMENNQSKVARNFL